MPREQLIGYAKNVMGELKFPSIGVAGWISSEMVKGISTCLQYLIQVLTVLLLIPGIIKAWKWVFDTFKKKPTTEEEE